MTIPPPTTAPPQTASAAESVGSAGESVGDVSANKVPQPVHEDTLNAVDQQVILLPGNDRPTDEAILLQQNDIRAEEASKLPYVGPYETLDSLKHEYSGGSEIFRLKIEHLEHSYSHMRRTRGDGNCFFRAFIFSYLEHLLITKDTQECSRLTSCIQAWRTKLVDFGYQELVFEDALDVLLQHVAGISEGLIGLEALEGAYRDDCVSNLVVMLLRLITSAEVQRREDFFLPFILGMYDEPPPTVELFCQRYVEPMAEESDNIHIVALTDALQVPVRVAYLDRSGAESLMLGSHNDASAETNTHDFVPEACAAQGLAPVVHVLYRPGHYDILYRREG